MAASRGAGSRAGAAVVEAVAAAEPGAGDLWAGRPTRAVPSLEGPVPEVARALLGIRLRSDVDAAVIGVIVETEAYLGPEDPASHAATRVGITPRNRAMFGPPGRAYVYRSYGVHWCLNVVTGPVGRPGAVLIRGLEVLEGKALALRRRAGRPNLAAGPGRLTQALGVDGAFDRHDLGRRPLRLLDGWDVSDALVEVTPRIGIRKAADWPLRYCVRGSPGVTP